MVTALVVARPAADLGNSVTEANRMGLRAWFKRRFGRAEDPTERVRFYDVETRRLVHLTTRPIYI